jgi:thymidylate synthase (FAD)
LEYFCASDQDPAITARISFNKLEVERTHEQDLKLYEYLIANQHNTPVEMLETWWHMQMPIFVARQLVRHRTACINEVSARYTVLPDKWYIPEKEFVGLYGKDLKQGRTGVGEEAWELLSEEQQETVQFFRSRLAVVCRNSYREYEEQLKAGIAPELARCFLHTNHYTHWVWKMDLHNLMHFMALRCDEHAQYEAQVYGDAVYEILKQFLPKSMEFFDLYRRKLTSKEKNHLKEIAKLLEHVQDSYLTEEVRATFAKVLKRTGVK